MKATDGQREIQRSRQSDGNGLKKKKESMKRGSYTERSDHSHLKFGQQQQRMQKSTYLSMQFTQS